MYPVLRHYSYNFIFNPALKKKPLVEAILEVRWFLTSPTPETQVDPYYKFILGSLYERVKKHYPELERLASSLAPEELVGNTVTHRFRSSAKGWPLIQIGPGIMTFNDTKKFKWEDFKKRSIEAVNYLYKSHPKPEELKISTLSLRYIDAVEFDYQKRSIFDFLKEKMNVQMELPDSLFRDKTTDNIPTGFRWESSYKCKDPKGSTNLRFYLGKKDGKPGLIWEIMVASPAENIGNLPSDFPKWIDKANRVSHDWFFTLIEGDLIKEFS